MSKQKRKISYWSFEFLSGEQVYFNADIFCRFMSYLKNLESQKLLCKDEKNNKAISLESIVEETKKNIHYYKVIFKSCKYNHSPDYMSSLDGSERPTDKLLTEGDKELTHMCFRIDAEEAYVIFEERRNGVSIGATSRYMNRFLKDFIAENEDLEDNFNIYTSIIPSDDFITSLGKTSRISSAELFVEKKILGSDYLQLMDLDANAQNDLIITVKSKPRKSLAKREFENAFIALATEGTKINRIRIRAKDLNNMDVIIDSLNYKKIDQISVDLCKNGVVDSHSFFAKIEELLGVTK